MDLLISFVNQNFTPEYKLGVLCENKEFLWVKGEVALNCNGITGLAVHNNKLIAAFQQGGLGVFDKSFNLLHYHESEQIKDPHSLGILNNKLFVVSTGRNSVYSYQLTRNGLIKNEELFYQYPNVPTDYDYVHLNSLIVNPSKAYATCLGLREKGEYWKTISNGKLIDLNSGKIILEGLNHPHSLLELEDGKIIFCESKLGMIKDIDGNILSKFNGYTRGLAKYKNNFVVVENARRKLSTAQNFNFKGRIGEYEEQEITQSSLHFLSTRNFIKKKVISLAEYGNEVYDVLPLQKGFINHRSQNLVNARGHKRVYQLESTLADVLIKGQKSIDDAESRINQLNKILEKREKMDSGDFNYDAGKDIRNQKVKSQNTKSDSSAAQSGELNTDQHGSVSANKLNQTELPREIEKWVELITDQKVNESELQFFKTINSKLETENMNLKSRLDQVRHELHKIEVQYHQKKFEAQGYLGEMERLKTNKDKLEAEIGELKDTLFVLENTNKSIITSNNEALAHISLTEDLENQNRVLQEKIHKVTSELVSKTQTVNRTIKLNHELELEVNALKEQRDTFFRESEESKLELTKVQEKNSELEQKLSQAQTEFKQQQQYSDEQYESLVLQRKALEEKVLELGNAVLALKLRRDKLFVQHREDKGVILKLEEKYGELERHNKGLNDELKLRKHIDHQFSKIAKENQELVENANNLLEEKELLNSQLLNLSGQLKNFQTLKSNYSSLTKEVRIKDKQLLDLRKSLEKQNKKFRKLKRKSDRRKVRVKKGLTQLKQLKKLNLELEEQVFKLESDLVKVTELEDNFNFVIKANQKLESQLQDQHKISDQNELLIMALRNLIKGIKFKLDESREEIAVKTESIARLRIQLENSFNAIQSEKNLNQKLNGDLIEQTKNLINREKEIQFRKESLMRLTSVINKMALNIKQSHYNWNQSYIAMKEELQNVMSELRTSLENNKTVKLENNNLKSELFQKDKRILLLSEQQRIENAKQTNLVNSKMASISKLNKELTETRINYETEIKAIKKSVSWKLGYFVTRVISAPARWLKIVD